MNSVDRSADDERYMRRALALAVRGLRTCAPNPAVGCVIVADGRVAGEGWHRRAGEPHAEALALSAAGARAEGATVYVTLEPCVHRGRTPPCAPALAAAGVRRVVVAETDPNPLVAGRGLALLREAGVEASCGVCAGAARRINRGFFSRFERGAPWLTLKLAASLDGRTALADGTSRWITGTVARAAVHRRRSRAGAVLTGIGTVLADDPALTARVPGVERQPLRIVLDSRLRTPPAARLFEGGGAVQVFGTVDDPARRRNLQAAGAQVRLLDADARGRPALGAVLAALAELEVNEVYAECGPTLAGAILEARLADEVELFFGPHLLGPAARALALLDGAAAIPEPPPLSAVWARRAGRDVRVKLVRSG